MTEERKKELAEETIIKMFPGVTKEHPMTTIGFMQLIDTVAAESREEGIEEIEMSLFRYIIETGPLDSKVVKLVAECLKEKRK